MFKKPLAIALAVLLSLPPITASAFSSSEVLMGIALNYYKDGNYDEALDEFGKVLLVDPENSEARYYIQEIGQLQERSRVQQVTDALDVFEGRPKRTYAERAQERQKALEQDLKRFAPPDTPIVLAGEKKEKKPLSNYVKVSGEIKAAAAADSSGEFTWNYANADLNERNFRILWGPDRYNTYDPAIYDRVRVNIDSQNLGDLGCENVGVHMNVTVDPWSYTGKTDTFTLTGEGGDKAEFELKYWGNTQRTINQIVPTLSNGDAMALPELDVDDGESQSQRVRTTFGNYFNIPSQDIDSRFWPLREFWMDYKGDPVSLRVFPMAYQDQALTTDDPLGLSNKHTWWEESPWLAEWRPGNRNTGAIPNDFSKGYWNDSLAFFTRDSDNLRLTALRGFSFGYDGVDLGIESTLASPKNIWEDYGYFNTYAHATRVKYDAMPNLGLGLTGFSHHGYSDNELDGVNFGLGVDGKFEPWVGTKFSAQVASSHSDFDLSDGDFNSTKRGNAYLFSVENRYPQEDIYDQDFNAVRKKGQEEETFLKSRLRLARMDSNFESTLSSYRETRDDEFWSRHISFRKHPMYLYTGLSAPMSFDDIMPFSIGDGLDSGRDVIGLRLEGATDFISRPLDALFDVRNVHDVNGTFLENVARTQLSYQMTDKLTGRFFGLRQDMADTADGIDPFVFSSVTGDKLVNTSIEEGEDPSLSTVSFGFNYDVNKKFSFNSVWEYTNDASAATDNYPRGLFNDASFTTVVEDGKVYREPIPFLYSQQYFDLPPYDYFSIYKFGFSYRPIEELEFYLDFAINENEYAGQIDDNMNHVGLEVAWVPVYKWTFLLKYVYSRWVDLNRLNATGESVFEWHNNFFFESRYYINDVSEFIFDFGVGGITPLASATYDPFGGALAVLDTQHIVRCYYRKRF